MKRILIIDDSITVRMYQKQILSIEDYEVDEAENGMEALEKVSQNNNYDLLLVDVNMPILDGYSFVKKFRQNYMYEIPIIMVSTESEKSDFLMSYESGANFYKVKPINTSELLTIVKFLTYNNELI